MVATKMDVVREQEHMFLDDPALLKGFRLCFESCVAQVKPLVSSTVKEKKTKKTTKICTNSAIYWLWTHLRAYIKE